MSKLSPLLPIANVTSANVLHLGQLFTAGEFESACAAAQSESARLENQFALTLKKPDGVADSPSEQYRACTAWWVNALAAQEKWKEAKEVMGRYRVRFPHDAWGFDAGAEVTRRDPQVKDKAAVARAIELLEGEAQRLKQK